MKTFKILTKKKNVVAVELNTEISEEELSNIISSGFKESKQVRGTDKDQAIQLWMGNNPAKRGLISTVNKWVYFAFHGVMVLWWMSYTADVGGMITDNTGDQYENAANVGAVIGGAIGTSMIFTIWGLFGIFGAFILLMTRAKPWVK